MALCVYLAFFLPLTFIKSAKFSLEVPFIGKVSHRSPVLLIQEGHQDT